MIIYNQRKRDIIMKKILGAILAVVIMAQVSLAAPFNAKAKTKRIPSGTKL